MRYGLIVAPTTLSDLRPSPGTLDSDLIRSRLPHDDVGIDVVDIDPKVDVAEQIDRFFDEHPDGADAIVFYASTLVALSPDGAIFLCLDPTNPDVGDALADVAAALREKHEGPLLFVLDCRHAPNDDDPFFSSTIVTAIRTALEPAVTGIELLVAAQSTSPSFEDAASPFTRAFVSELDEADPRRTLAAGDLYERIHASERLLGVVPSFAYTRGRAPFELLHGDGTVGDESRFLSMPDREEARAASMSDAEQARASSMSDREEPSETTAAVIETSAEIPDSGDDGGEPAAHVSDDAQDEHEHAQDEHEHAQDEHEHAQDEHEHAQDEHEHAQDEHEHAQDEEPEEAAAAAPEETAEDYPQETAAAAPDETDASDDEDSVDVDLEESGAHHHAIFPPAPEPGAEPEPEPEPVVEAPKHSSVIPSAMAAGGGERAVTIARLAISERPVPADPGSLPKIVISDRPPPRMTSEPPKALSDAPRAVSERPRAASERPAAVSEAPKAAVAKPDEPATKPEEPAEPEPAKEPTFADYLAQGDALASRDAEGALAEYKKALLLVTPAQKEERADVYVRIGEVKLLQDKRREAISNFEKSTQLSPNHRPALEAIAKLSAEERDWRGVAATEEKILATLTDPEVRFSRLVEFGERWAGVAYDTDRARSAFLRAREIKPDDLAILAKLVRIHEVAGATEEAFALRREIADKTSDGRERATLYAALGKVCLEEQKDEEAALAFFEKALDADPTMLEPLATAATLLAERQEWSELEATYRRMLPRTERIPEAAARGRVRWELNRRLALLFRDHLEDPEAALRAFEKAIADRPDDIATRQTAAALARDLGKWEAARSQLQACAKIDPMVVQTYHDLFDIFQKLGRPDQAWAAASVTAQLGHADQRERFIYDEGKTEGPPKPTRALGDDAWDLLRDSERDHTVEGVLEAITKAAIEAKLAELRTLGRLPSLDPAARQDPKKSTVSIVRSFAWASHLLGVAMPAVYLRDDAQVGLAAVIAEEPAVIAGAGVLRGRSLTELAFAAGRHLGYHVGAHRLLLYYPVIDDLALCFLAAVRIVMPKAGVPAKMEKQTAAMQARLEPLLDARSRAALERAVVALDAAGSRADLHGWVAAVERCSTRAGYLLSNDMRTAATSLSAEGPGVLTVEAKMVDLLWFTVSEAFHELRDALGIAIEP